MAYHQIDFDSWPRRPHFELFDAMDHPWLDICCPVDATKAWEICGADDGPSFFAASLFLAIGAVNAVEELRMRIRNGRVVVHDHVYVGSTFPRDDDTFGFGFIKTKGGFAAFSTMTVAERERIRIQRDELIDQDNDDLIHFSVVPWLNFTGIGHPRHRNSAYSIPKIVIGRCYQQDSRWMVSVALSAHHGLVDGLHAARFFDQFQRRLHQAEPLLAT